MKNLIGCLAVFLILTSCSSTIPLRSNYLNSQSRIGIIIKTNKIQCSAHSSGFGLGVIGVLASAALTPRSKYDEALNAIEPDLEPTKKLKQFYLNIFYKKGKQVVFIDDDIDLRQLKDFPASGNKYFRKDVRFMKDKYQVDELLVVSVVYGLYTHYSYGIEISRYARTYLQPEIIDLGNNSIIYNDHSSVLIPIRGEWNTPPYYENLANGIQESIDQVIIKEKIKY